VREGTSVGPGLSSTSRSSALPSVAAEYASGQVILNRGEAAARIVFT
jgi:hypothetical protein